MNPPEGFIVPPLAFENVEIAYHRDGRVAYYCPVEDEWIVGDPIIEKDEKVTRYTCGACEHVIAIVGEQ